MAWTHRRHRPHARPARSRCRRVLRRPVPRLHVLPRRARAPQARARVSHALLSHDLARRRDRRGAGRASLAPLRACRADFELAGALVLLRAAAAVAGAPRTAGVSACSRSAALARRRSAAACWSVIDFYENTIVASRNFYGVLRVQEAGDEANGDCVRQLIHGTILHGKQYLRDDLKRQADELLHGQLRHRPR